MSPKAHALLLHIRGQFAMRQPSPTRRELARLMGWPSHARVDPVLRQLMTLGLITYQPRKQRTIRLVASVCELCGAVRCPGH